MSAERTMQNRIGRAFSPERELFRRSIGAHKDMPGAVLFHALRDAVERKATHIHISGADNFEGERRVEFRVNGKMESWRNDLPVSRADAEVICRTLAWTLSDDPWGESHTKFRCGLVTWEQFRALPQGVQAAEISLAPLVGGHTYAVINLYYKDPKGEGALN